MDYREKAFRTKFECAALELGTVPQQIISLKLRENISNHHEYGELLHALTQKPGLKSTPVDGELQGNGHLVESPRTKIIVVEHETGLEILYIAASVASLLGLIPLVLKCWNAIRGHMRRPHHRDFERVEVRRLGQDGYLVEEGSHRTSAPSALPSSGMDSALLLAAESVDAELHGLRSDLQALTARVVALEGQSTKARKASKKKASKKQVRKKRGK